MFTRYRTEGIVLKKADRYEADQIFTVFSKDYGSIEVVGKGIRKIASKLRAGAQVLRFSEIEFIQGKSSKTLTDALCKEKFAGINADLKKTNAGAGIARISGELLKNSGPDERAWDLLLKTLFFLESSPARAADAASHWYCWNLLSVLGWRPDLETCCACGQALADSKAGFCSEEKGIICFECLKKLSPARAVSADILNLLKMILTRPLSRLGALRITLSQNKALEELEKKYCQAVAG